MDLHRCRFVDYNPHGITALAFSRRSDLSQLASPDLRLAVGRENGDIEIWNPRWQWLHETTLRGGKGRSVEGLAWSNSGESNGKPRLFSIGGSTAITEWNVATGQPRVNYDCHSGVIWSIAVSDDGTKLAAGCENGSVVVVDLTGGPGVMEHSRVLQRHSCRVLSLAWRGSHVVGGCSDARIRVWGDDGSTIATMKVDTAKGAISRDDATLVWTVAVVRRARGDVIVSGDSTGSVKFWDCAHYALKQSFTLHEADVLCLAVDASGDAVYSAGVDKTIAVYEAIGKRWSQTNVRGYHAHDVRALATYEAKNLSLLASGGVEKVLVVGSVNEFAQGPYRKFSVAPQRPQTFVYGSVVAMWNDQTVKLWRLNGGERRLVCKLTLSADDNISAVAMFGSLLAVSTLQETKLFELEEAVSSKGHPVLKPNKLMDLNGASKAVFSPAGDLLLVSNDQCELISLNEESAPIEELLVPEANLKDSMISHGHETEIVAVAFSVTHLALSRRSGHTEIFARGEEGFRHARTLMRLSASPATALAFTGAKTLVVATADNKVVEFDLGSGLLTEWSRQNPEIPDPVASSVDHCTGMFIDPSPKHSQRVWMWGATWIAFVDTSVNIPVERVPKRRLDGEETAKPSVSETPDATTAFWSTAKYRPIIAAEIVGNGELVVVERPSFDIPLPAAFWSKKKKRVD